MDDAHEMVAWLLDVLDTLDRGPDGPMDATRMSRRKSDRARVEAERAVVELHKPWNGGGRVTYCSEFEHDEQQFPCPTLQWLAYGHRHDALGYRDEWAPEGVRPATG